MLSRYITLSFLFTILYKGAIRVTDEILKMAICGLLKKGLVYESKDLNVELELPAEEAPIKISIKATDIQVRISSKIND